MKTGFLVADAMTKKPILVSPEKSIRFCAETMKEHKIGSLVVTGQDKLLGITTEQDIIRKVVALGKNPDEVTVKEIMVKDLIVITPDKDIFEAINLMHQNNIRHLPVMDRSVLIGFLTMKDILKIEPTLFEIIVEKYKLREEDEKPLSGDEGICQLCGKHSKSLSKNNDDILSCRLCSILT
jgi:CBS domain-containing protein